MSWRKCLGVPRGQPPGMAADKCKKDEKRTPGKVSNFIELVLSYSTLNFKSIQLLQYALVTCGLSKLKILFKLT